MRVRYLKKRNFMIGMINNRVRIELKQEFQKNLFENLLGIYDYEFGCVTKISKLLNISRQTIYAYRYGYIKSVPKRLLIKIQKILKLKEDTITKNTLNITSDKEIKNKGLIKGREFRKRKIKNHFKINSSVLDMLRKDDDGYYIDLLDWFKETKWIDKLKICTGFVRILKNPEVTNNHIILYYTSYNKKSGRSEEYTTYLPRKLYFNKEFLYFLGFMYGDGLSSARVGIINKDLNLIREIARYLKDIFPNSKIEGQIYVYKKDIDKEKLCSEIKNYVDHITIYNNFKAAGEYVFAVSITNNFIKRILDNIFENMIELFNKLSLYEKGAFFAGFFDAEGNVNKLGKNLRFSQKSENKVEIIISLLNKEGYHTYYDGSNICIAYHKENRKSDFNLFEKQILPFIKHIEKKKESSELLSGYLVRDCYKPIVKIISKNPGIDNNGLFKITKRKRNQRQLTALTDANFVSRNRKKIDESFKYYVSEKGLKWIQ